MHGVLASQPFCCSANGVAKREMLTVSQSLFRSFVIWLLIVACPPSSVAGEQHQWVVVHAAVFISDPTVVGVQLFSGQFSFGPADPTPYWNERSKRRYAAHSKRYADTPLQFNGRLLSPSADEVPELESITVQWSVKGMEDSKSEAVIPLQQYGNLHNFLNAALLITVQPSGVLVELLEDRENKVKKFYRCLGSSFSASGACSPRYDLVPLGVFSAKSTPLLGPTAQHE